MKKTRIDIYLTNGNILTLNDVEINIDEFQKKLQLEGIIKLETKEGIVIIRSSSIDAVDYFF